MAAPPVTLAMPAYNQEDYVAAALEGALAQTYEPLEIVVSDDASSDRTYEIAGAVAARYEGPHRIRLHRNETNRGVENYNRMMELSDTDFVVVAHADDVSRPDRVAKMVAAWQEHGVSLVSSNALRTDPQGRELGLLVPPEETGAPDLAAYCEDGWQARSHGATLGWTREVFSVFGGLSLEHTWISTDWVLPFRACLLNGIHYIGEPLIRYRRHDESRSGKYLFRESRLPNIESNLSNRAIQQRYLLITLREFIKNGGELEDWKRYEAMLVRAFIQTTSRWARVRNMLLGERLRIEWLED